MTRKHAAAYSPVLLLFFDGMGWDGVLPCPVSRLHHLFRIPFAGQLSLAWPSFFCFFLQVLLKWSASASGGPTTAVPTDCARPTCDADDVVLLVNLLLAGRTRSFLGLRRDDLALPEERRRRMFEAEARVTLGEERDAAVAKSTLEVCADCYSRAWPLTWFIVLALCEASFVSLRHGADFVRALHEDSRCGG